MNKLKIWQSGKSWDEAALEWDAGAVAARQKNPIKTLDKLPHMVGITPETKKHLKWKSFLWMIKEDHDRKVLKGFLRRPIKHLYGYIKSLLSGKSYKREGDFFLYGVQSIKEFEALLQDENKVFVLGFSYCHKPFECPSGRFTSDCIHDAENPVCRQCFIGKAFHLAPDSTIKLAIPTVHYIGGKIFEIQAKNPSKDVIFIITACEMTLEMFGDWGLMAGIKGLGVRLSGRICNTMKAFELSEKGIKPGLTVVLEPTERAILALLKLIKS